MEGMGAMASLQYFKNQLSYSEKYILNPERFFYKTIYQSVEHAVSLGILSGDPAMITEDILGITRGIIYDWCLHEGSYTLSEHSLRVLDMILNYYARSDA